METGDQRKFGYGGGLAPDRGDDDDGGWEPGGEGEPSPVGLFVLLAAGAWALWEYRRQAARSTADQEGYRAPAVRGAARGASAASRRVGGGTGKINVG